MLEVIPSSTYLEMGRIFRTSKYLKAAKMNLLIENTMEFGKSLIAASFFSFRISRVLH